jgi:hypothetical protein
MTLYSQFFLNFLIPQNIVMEATESLTTPSSSTENVPLDTATVASPSRPTRPTKEAKKEKEGKRFFSKITIRKKKDAEELEVTINYLLPINRYLENNRDNSSKSCEEDGEGVKVV